MVFPLSIVSNCRLPYDTLYTEKTQGGIFSHPFIHNCLATIGPTDICANLLCTALNINIIFLDLQTLTRANTAQNHGQLNS